MSFVSFGFLLRSIANRNSIPNKWSTLLRKFFSARTPFSSAMHFFRFFLDCSIFWNFLELNGQNAETSLHSGNNANNSFHFPRDGRSATLQGESTLQFQGRHGPLESNFQELPKVLSWSLRCYIPWSKHQGHLGHLWKRETPSTVQTTAPQMPCDALCIHLCLSNWMDLWSALPRIHNTFWNVRTKRLNHTSIIGVENDSANGANNLAARARFTCTIRENYTWKLRPFHLKGPRDAVFFLYLGFINAFIHSGNLLLAN